LSNNSNPPVVHLLLFDLSFKKKHIFVIMLYREALSKEISGLYIFYMQCVTYFKTGYILHAFSIFVFVLFLNCFESLQSATGIKQIIYSLLTMFFFSITITSQMDAYSRFQNYKMVKDMLYQHGYREFFLKPFSRSRCQRDAVTEAATQLGLNTNVDLYFKRLGYRWYHIIPSVLLENPLVMLTKNYWYTTFFVSYYKSKYFCW